MAGGEKVNAGQMKISQLSRATGITRSAIHYYLNLGLLHPPEKVGLNLHLFDDTHLTRLKQIHQMKKDKGLTLSSIRELLCKEATTPLKRGLSTDKAGRGSIPPTESQTEEPAESPQSQANREKIIDTAIHLFSEKGYETTSICDITDALRMGKSTFYLYFNTKKELFMDCIDRLTVMIVPQEAWADIRSEQDFYEKQFKRGVAFQEAFPGYRGIINLLRASLGGRDEALAKKAAEAFKVMLGPIAKDLRRAIAAGELRADVDVELYSYLQIVVAEGIGYWLMMGSRYSNESATQLMVDMARSYLDKKPHEEQDRPPQRGPAGDVSDRKGFTVKAGNIRIDGKPWLQGRIGDTQVIVDLDKLAYVRFSKKKARTTGKVTMKDGQRLEIAVDAENSLTADASFGSIEVPLKNLASICFEEGGQDREES